MALQLGALRDALEDAGASPEKSAKAAEELAGYDNRLAGMDTRLTLLTWMVGLTLVLTVFTLGSMVSLWFKVGEISGQLTQIARAVVP